MFLALLIPVWDLLGPQAPELALASLTAYWGRPLVGGRSHGRGSQRSVLFPEHPLLGSAGQAPTQVAKAREAAGSVEDTPLAGERIDASGQSAESGRGASSKHGGKTRGIKLK